MKELFRPSQKRDPAAWAAEHRVYPETAGIPGPRNPWLTPYMIPWSSAAHNGGYRRVVAVTSAQSGKTDSMLDIIGARLDQRPAPIIYVGPTKDFLTDQFEPRLMGLLDEAETLRNKVVSGRWMKGIPLFLRSNVLVGSNCGAALLQTCTEWPFVTHHFSALMKLYKCKE